MKTNEFFILKICTSADFDHNHFYLHYCKFLCLAECRKSLSILTNFLYLHDICTPKMCSYSSTFPIYSLSLSFLQAVNGHVSCPKAWVQYCTLQNITSGQKLKWSKQGSILTLILHHSGNEANSRLVSINFSTTIILLLNLLNCYYAECNVSLGSIRALCRALGRGTDLQRLYINMPPIQGCMQGYIT